MRLLLLWAMAPCGGIVPAGQAGPTTPSVETEPAARDQPDIAELNEMEARCRSTIAATTFQQAARALTDVRAAIGRLCTIELVGDTPLQWRVSCGSDDFFGSGRHEFENPTACEGGNNAFECLGHGLRSMVGHVANIDVAVVGHVDSQLPRNMRLSCSDLANAGWAAPPWQRVHRHRERANDRLAWCRAARAAHAVGRGLGEAPLRTAAIGASSTWLDRRLSPALRARETETESGDAQTPALACPNGTDPDDVPADGRCQSARRVDVLIRLAAAPQPAETACSRENNSAQGALFCLEECMARPERSRSGLANPAPFLRNERSARVPERWLLTRSAGAPAVSLSRVLQRLEADDGR